MLYRKTVNGCCKCQVIPVNFETLAYAKIENTNIEFLFGYVVEHVNPRFHKDDWFASSYLVKIEKLNDCFVAETANSIYRIPTYTTITVPLKALDNIRMGTPPEQALRILQGSFSQPLH